MYKKDRDPENLFQGDIILDYENEELLEYKPKKFYKGILILSYTCDLVPEQIGISYITVCPIYSLEYLILILFQKFKDGCKEAKTNRRENCIRKGITEFLKNIFEYNTRLYYFLKPNPIFDNKPLIADLQQISNLSVKNYKDLLNHKKLSLDSPWIEKLGYMTGYLYNRIALENFPKTEIKGMIDEDCNPIITQLICDNKDNL